MTMELTDDLRNKVRTEKKKKANFQRESLGRFEKILHPK